MGERVMTLASIKLLYERTGGQAWEPGDLHHPHVKTLVDGGWVKRCHMRCGFEAFDTGVSWTDAARLALQPTPTNERNM